MVVAAFAAPAFAWAPATMDVELNNGVYSIIDDDGTFCSAFDTPKDGYVATAAHCVADQFKENKDYVFRLKQDWEKPDGLAYRVVATATLVKRDDLQDIAVLKIKTSPAAHKSTLKFATKFPIRGETVWVAGAPFGRENTLTKGIMSNAFIRLEPLYKAMPVYQIDAPVGPGNSGGPIFNDDGEVIAVVSATRMTMMPMTGEKLVNGAQGFGIPISHIQAMLDAIK